MRGIVMATELGIEGTQFTLNNQPTFLLGISYYGALGASEEFIRRDLDDMQRYGFNWIRVWATWDFFDNDVSAVDREGKGREPFMGKLKWLVAECDRRGIVVDVTLSRGDGVKGVGRLQTLDAHRCTVETLITALKSYRNWYLDLANERNISEPRHVSFAELKELRGLAKRMDPERLITASHAGDISRDDLREYLMTVQVDFISPHRPRNPDSPKQTKAKSRKYLGWMKEMGRVAPLHYQEPFRRGFRPDRWEPPADAFLTDLQQAKAGGAAGWCFHNGDQKDKPEGKPRRSFDLREQRLFEQLDAEERKVFTSFTDGFAFRFAMLTESPLLSPAENQRTRQFEAERSEQRGEATFGLRFEQLAPSPSARVDPPSTVFPDADWQEASPDSQGVDSAKLKEAIAYMDSNFGPDGARELVIIRNGYPIWKSPHSDAYHNVWSATKTFTSTVLGLLVADGKCSLDDLAIKYSPGLDDQYPLYCRIRLRHLASMSSGYKGQVVHVTAEQPWGEPLAYLTPTAPLFEAGTQVQYHDHQVFLLGSILTRLAGESEKALFKRRIADPIGMTQWDWGVSGTLNGLELNNAAGTPTTPGIQATARQMARFGLLYLNRGNWKGRQLLPPSFVDEATKNHVPGIGASAFLHGRYGFYWWTNDIMPNGKRPWPSAPPRAYTSHGHSANFCFVIPEWNMVVARMGTEPIRSGVAKVDSLWDIFFAMVADALGITSQRGN